MAKYRIPAYGTNSGDHAQAVDERMAVSSRSLKAARKQNVVIAASKAMIPALTTGITHGGTRFSALRVAAFVVIAVSALIRLLLCKRITGVRQTFSFARSSMY